MLKQCCHLCTQARSYTWLIWTSGALLFVEGLIGVALPAIMKLTPRATWFISLLNVFSGGVFFTFGAPNTSLGLTPHRAHNPSAFVAPREAYHPSEDARRNAAICGCRAGVNPWGAAGILSLDTALAWRVAWIKGFVFDPKTFRII